MLPNWLKENLRKREDGRDIIGIKLSYHTVKKAIEWIRRRYGTKNKGRSRKRG